MKTTDFTATTSAAKLNESMFKKFGTKINFENYGREELENYRNLLRTKVNQTESSAGFNDLIANESYQKDKFMLDLLNTKIKEMLGEAKIMEKSTSEKQARTMAAAAHDPKFAKKVGIKKRVAKEFNKADTGTRLLSKAMKHKKAAEGIEGTNMTNTTEAVNKKKFAALAAPKGKITYADKIAGAKKAAAKKAGPVKEALKGGQKKLDVAKPKGKLDANDFKALRAKKKVKESVMSGHYKVIIEGLQQFIAEDEEGKAKDITAGTDMVNDFTSWMQRVGQYQTKTMLELSDNIRANFGQAEAEAFKSTIQPALDQALAALAQARESITGAVAVLAGEENAEQMGAEPMNTGGAEGSEPSAIDSMNTAPEVGDEFGASDAAVGGAETAGRGMRESRELKRARKLSEAHSIMSKLSR